MTTPRQFADWLFHRVTGVPVRVKIVGMVLGAALLLGLSMTLAVRARLAADLRHSLEERGVAITRQLAARATDLVLTENTFVLHQLTRETLENNLDVRYVFVLDATGQPLVHSFPESVPPELLTVNQPAANQVYRLQALESDEGRLLDVTVPILEGRAGIVRVGLSEARLQARIARVTWELLAITATALLLAAAIALFLTRVLTRPVLELVEATRRVGEGDLEARARHYMADEIGELALAFNAMAARLQASHADLLRRLRELATLNATAAAISGALNLDELLPAALAKIMEAMDLQAGWVFLEAEGGPRPLYLAAHQGLSPTFAAQEATCEFGRCVCARVLERAQPMIMPDILRECPRLSPEVIAAEGLVCHASVPLLSRERVLGVLNVASAEARDFSEQDLALLDSIGRQLGVGIENARLWAQVKEKEALRGQLLEKTIAAQEAERQRLARELHDEAGQALTSLKFGLRSLERCVASAERSAQLDSLRALVGEIQEGLHDLAVELHPPALDELGLAAAVQHLASQCAHHTGLKVDSQAIGLNGERIDPHVSLAAYRLIQEALTNAARHAGAQRISIVLERQKEQLIVIVDDDGHGFDPSDRLGRQTSGSRLGLHSMQERVELLGGVFTIESRPGEGTTVFARLPLPAEAAPGEHAPGPALPDASREAVEVAA